MSILKKITQVFIAMLLLTSCGEAAKTNQVVLTSKNTVVFNDEVNGNTA
jgi:uncharacterized protein YcfL